MRRATLDVIGRTALAHDFHALDTYDRPAGRESNGAGGNGAPPDSGDDIVGLITRITPAVLPLVLVPLPEWCLPEFPAYKVRHFRSDQACRQEGGHPWRIASLSPEPVTGCVHPSFRPLPFSPRYVYGCRASA